MEFCDSCENKMSIKWKNSNEDRNPDIKNEKLLIYYCTTCGNIKHYDKNTIVNPKLYHQNYKVDKSFITFNNELLCSDPTLQKAKGSEIKCPTCSKDKKSDDEDSDIVYYIYDTNNMKYLYICCKCKSSWKTE